MAEESDSDFPNKDDYLPISITHSRDVISFDGKVEQDYRFLTYRFKGNDAEIVARVYFDDPWRLSITSPMFDAPIPDEALTYMQRRFRIITQLGGADGYAELWSEEVES
jgi:hypothetical protein